MACKEIRALPKDMALLEVNEGSHHLDGAGLGYINPDGHRLELGAQVC